MESSEKKIIAIGALGGSGTRAVGQIFIKMGVFMGNDLDIPKDNLLFTRLFKNPGWYAQSSLQDKNVRLRIFQKCMEGNKLSFNELKELNKAAYTNPTFESDWTFYINTIRYLFQRERKITWGWKEPNTQIYLSEVFNFFPQLKYIHVLRHGLDMAFSKNIQQLGNWGWKYNIKIKGNENKSELAVKQLNYWIGSTKDVMEKSNNFRDRFLLLNYTDFCQKPKLEIDKILKFCNFEVSRSMKEKLYKIPKNKGSNNRYKKKDLSIFSEEQFKAVRELGFKV